MLGKQHSEEAKKKISDKISKYPNGVGIYDLNNNLIKKFKNNIELVLMHNFVSNRYKHLNISKVTVGKYLSLDLVYKNQYRFKVNNK